MSSELINDNNDAKTKSIIDSPSPISFLLLDDCLNVKHDDNVDQLQMIIDSLKDEEERYSRRLIMTAWNPLQLHQMALPPCHILSQFCVNDDELSCILYQRSGDIGLGIPFNIASYSFLTILLAHHCGLKAYEFVLFTKKLSSLSLLLNFNVFASLHMSSTS